VERRRSALRTALVWDALQVVLAPAPLRVVDLGGGTGEFAVRIAELGHQVTVVDPSPDALASLERRAAESGVAVAPVLGDADSLLDVVEPASADLVLCHGLLEVVPEPSVALDRVAGALVDGGMVSVLAAQKSGAVLTRAFTGHLAEARALLDHPEGRGGVDGSIRRFSRVELVALLDSAGFAAGDVRGVRIFTDYVSSSLVDSEPGAADELRALEAAVAGNPEFMAMATQLHVLATKL
jgi:S-adenosylmethionine-dependent methyltransferase